VVVLLAAVTDKLHPLFCWLAWLVGWTMMRVDVCVVDLSFISSSFWFNQ
jgi:hypothetical protein